MREEHLIKLIEDVGYIRAKIDLLPCKQNIENIKKNTEFKNKALGVILFMSIIIPIVVSTLLK